MPTREELLDLFATVQCRVDTLRHDIEHADINGDDYDIFIQDFVKTQGALKLLEERLWDIPVPDNE